LTAGVLATAQDDAEVVVVVDQTHRSNDLVERVGRQHTVTIGSIKSFDPAAYPACHLYLFDIALSGQSSLKRLRSLVGFSAYERSARVFILDTHNRGKWRARSNSAPRTTWCARSKTTR
jgi:hypothetical protein